MINVWLAGWQQARKVLLSTPESKVWGKSQLCRARSFVQLEAEKVKSSGYHSVAAVYP